MNLRTIGAAALILTGCGDTAITDTNTYAR